MLRAFCISLLCICIFANKTKASVVLESYADSKTSGDGSITASFGTLNYHGVNLAGETDLSTSLSLDSGWGAVSASTLTFLQVSGNIVFANVNFVATYNVSLSGFTANTKSQGPLMQTDSIDVDGSSMQILSSATEFQNGSYPLNNYSVQLTEYLQDDGSMQVYAYVTFRMSNLYDVRNGGYALPTVLTLVTSVPEPIAMMWPLGASIALMKKRSLQS